MALIEVEIDVDHLAYSLVDALNHRTLRNLVLEIDETVADLQWSKSLRDALNKAIEDEESESQVSD